MFITIMFLFVALIICMKFLDPFKRFEFIAGCSLMILFSFIGTFVSMNCTSKIPNEYTTQQFDVVQDSIFYDNFKPYVFIYKDREMKKMEPSKLIKTNSVDKPTLLIIKSVSYGVLCIGDSYEFSILLTNK